MADTLTPMYHQRYYKNLRQEQIIELVKKEGFSPSTIFNGPGYRYNPHTHPETKLLAFIKGNMTLTVNGKTYECYPGDKVLIPGNVLHEATVGPEGCEFLWAEKLI